MIANVQGSVLHTIGNNQYAQLNRANRTVDTNAVRESRFDVMPVSDGTVRTSVDGDVLTISPAGNAYADRAADVTAGVYERARISQISGTATDERVKAFVAAEENEEMDEVKARREERWAKKLEELMEDLEDKDLSGYTDSELAGMLSRGEISRAEYETETRNREELAELTGLGA